MLEITDLRVSYGSIQALKGAGLRVDAGEVVGLIGPNGAGKTTLLSAVFGLVKPRAGRVRFDGADLTGQGPERVVRAGLALVPEGRDIFGSLSVEENLRLGASARRDDEVQADLERQLDAFPVLRSYFKGSAAKLSGGEQQQLAIARALMGRPRMLLLDEPSLGLAPLMVDRVFDVLAALREQGVTILLVEQNAARTIEFADRTYVLRNGAVVASGSGPELASATDIAELYLGA